MSYHNPEGYGSSENLAQPFEIRDLRDRIDQVMESVQAGNEPPDWTTVQGRLEPFEESKVLLRHGDLADRYTVLSFAKCTDGMRTLMVAFAFPAEFKDQATVQGALYAIKGGGEATVTKVIGEADRWGNIAAVESEMPKPLEGDEIRAVLHNLTFLYDEARVPHQKNYGLSRFVVKYFK